MNFSILRKALLSSAALFVSAGAVYATSYTWCGRGETNADGSLNWEDSANWLKDGTTALTAGYPGQTAAGAASTSDYAVFPANYEAYVRVNAANNIYKLDFKNTTHKIILSGVSTNNLLTVNNTIDFSTGAGEIELELAGELPAVERLRRGQLDAENGVLHRKRGVMVTVPAGRLAVDEIGRPVVGEAVVGPHALQHEITVGGNLHPLLGKRFEDARTGVSEKIPLAVRGGHDPSGLADARALLER